MPTTRIAPSPTGALHLGNARTFLVNWLLARQQGWKIVLRIDDLDGPRIKPGADAQAIADLRWLGLDWDTPPVYQSSNKLLYDRTIETLLAAHAAYPCICSRKEVEGAASAPHAEDGAAVYPGTCRGKFATEADALQIGGRSPAIRFAVPPGIVEFDDWIVGQVRTDAARQLGDFVIRKSDATAAYQLAVVVDDANTKVTHIVRGDDLLDSTPRQILLYKALQWDACIPNYIHLPLVVGKDGRRLAKRHGDTRLSFYRGHGVSPTRMLALLAKWCGVSVKGEIDAPQLLESFRLENLPRKKIVFTEADDAWLRE